MVYIPIRIGTLRPDDVINFDLFVLIGEKYIHYIRNSDPFDGDRIEKLRIKGVKKLFIQEQEEPHYLKYLDRGLDQLQNDAISVEEKGTVLNDSMVTEAENAVRNVETQAGYQRTEGRMQKMVDFLTSDAGVFKNVLTSAGCSSDIFQHSATVSTLSVSLATKLGITKSSDLLEIGLAALFHDIGHTKLGFNALVSKDQLTLDQQKQYQEHPTIGASLLADKPYVTKAVLQLIADHEEFGDGVGFPNHKRISTLPLASQVLNLCNDYDRYSLLQQKLHMEIVKSYFQDRIGSFELEHIKTLFSLLKN